MADETNNNNGGFDPGQMPPFDPSKMPEFDPSKMPPFDPENFDPSKMPPFDPSKFPGFDPSKMPKDFDPSKLPPMPPMQQIESDATEDENVLKQEDPAKWLRQHPKKMRGNMRMAMTYGREAEKYKCTCWNKRCPFYGNCRKCIVFHMALKQIPTCQRDMIVEMIKDGTLAEEMYVYDPIPPKK